MTRRRSKRKTNGDAPITGVASGGLGTAANLDDTQVLSTADLQAAAPMWLDEPDPAAAQQPDVLPPEDLAALQKAPIPLATPTPEPAEPTIAVPVKATGAVPVQRASTSPVQRRGSSAAEREGSGPRRGRSAPALAGVIAVVVLLLVAGAGFVSQLDLGIANLPGGGPTSSAAAPTATPAATEAPKQEKGKRHGDCRGHGHDCGGSGED